MNHQDSRASMVAGRSDRPAATLRCVFIYIYIYVYIYIHIIYIYIYIYICMYVQDSVIQTRSVFPRQRTWPRTQRQCSLRIPGRSGSLQETARSINDFTTKSKVVVQSTLLSPRTNHFTKAFPPRGNRDPLLLAVGGTLPYEGARHCPGFSLQCSLCIPGRSGSLH